MKKLFLSLASLVGGIFAFLGLLRLMPAAWREKFTRLPAVMMGKMMEHMPDE